MEQMTLQLDRIWKRSAPTRGAPGRGQFQPGADGRSRRAARASAASRARMAVRGEAIAQSGDRAAARRRQPGRVEKYVYPFLYLDTSGSRDPEEVRLAAARAAMRQPAVAGYYTAGGACSMHDDWERRFRNSFHPKRSGDVMLSYQPEYVEDFGSGRGISYGSLYNYDVSRAAVLLRSAIPRRRLRERRWNRWTWRRRWRASSGVAAPSSSTGRVLAEALAE